MAMVSRVRREKKARCVSVPSSLLHVLAKMNHSNYKRLLQDIC